VTHGCVRMFPEDIEYLFAQIDLDTRVRIINEPVKMGWDGDQLVMEVHPILEVAAPEITETIAAEQGTDDDAAESVVADDDLETAVVAKDPLTYVTERFIDTTGERAGQLDWHLAEQLVDRSDGIPMPVGREIKNAATSAAFH